LVIPIKGEINRVITFRHKLIDHPAFLLLKEEYHEVGRWLKKVPNGNKKF